MRDPQMNEVPFGVNSLAMQATALRYAAGAMTSAESTAFEELLETEQPVRDALVEAVRLSAAVLGKSSPQPDRSLRDLVRARLFTRGVPGWLARRTYRGHPAIWAGLGAAVVAVSTVAALEMSERTIGPATVATPAVQSPVAATQRPAHDPLPTVKPNANEPTSLAMNGEPAEPTTELTAKMGPSGHVGKALEDDGKWKQR